MPEIKTSDVVRQALENWKKGKYANHGICRCLTKTEADLIGDASRPAWYNRISDMMGKQLHGEYVSKWLSEEAGIHPGLLTPENMREYRELWLKYLLEYYLSIGE